MSFPQALFLPRDFHQSLFLWPLLRDEPSWGSRGHHCKGRAGAACWGWSCLRAHRILPAAPCHCPDSALGPFLPSPQRVPISCFHFQWLGILGEDKGGLQHVSGVIYSSAFSPSCPFCWSFEIKYYSSRREEKNIMKESH